MKKNLTQRNDSDRLQPSCGGKNLGQNLEVEIPTEHSIL